MSRKQKQLDSIAPEINDIESPGNVGKLNSLHDDFDEEIESGEFEPGSDFLDHKDSREDTNGYEKERKPALDEHLRLLHIYFKDLEHLCIRIFFIR